MGKIAVKITCSDEDREELKRLSRSRKEPKQLIERADIILCCLDGKPNKVIANEPGTNAHRVGKWRRRFDSHGLNGLSDSTRSGKPKQHVDLRLRVLKMLEHPVPKGQSFWDGKALALALGVKKSSVYNILSKEGIQLQRKRSWCVSTDPEFAAKSADIIGLYLNPPERAVVLSVDEKPSIQALSRKCGYVQTSSKKIVQGLQSTYRRNGTLNLFAALNVSTGEVKKRTTAAKKREDFQSFMDDVVKDIPADQDIHIILDNYCTHKKNEEWLKKHPNVYFHFTPTSASWLNQVEIWFGILTRKALKNASFNSVEELSKAIEDFCDVYHKNAKPFVWKKREVKGAQLRNTVANLME